MSGRPWMHIDPAQIPTDLKQPAMDAGYPPDRSDVDDDPCDGMDDDPDCSWCGGDSWTECDDPIQCCDPRCDGDFHPCPACHGTGLARNQVIW